MRQHRVDLNIKIDMKYPDRDTFIDRFAPNISSTGIFIRADVPAAIGSRIHFDCRLANGTRILRGLGIVRWVRTAAEAKQIGTTPGMGVDFVDLDADSEQLINLIVTIYGEGKLAPKRAKPAQRQSSSVQKHSNYTATPFDHSAAELEHDEANALDALLGSSFGEEIKKADEIQSAAEFKFELETKPETQLDIESETQAPQLEAKEEEEEEEVEEVEQEQEISEPGIEVELGEDIETETREATKAETVFNQELGQELEPDLKPEPETEPESGSEIESETELETEPESESEPELEPEQVLNLELESEPEPKPEPESNLKLESKPESVVEATPDSESVVELTAQEEKGQETTAKDITESEATSNLPSAAEHEEAIESQDAATVDLKKEPELEPESTAIDDTSFEPEAAASALTDSASQPESELEPELESQPEPALESQSELEPPQSEIGSEAAETSFEGDAEQQPESQVIDRPILQAVSNQINYCTQLVLVDENEQPVGEVLQTLPTTAERLATESISAADAELICDLASSRWRCALVQKGADFANYGDSIAVLAGAGDKAIELPSPLSWLVAPWPASRARVLARRLGLQLIDDDSGFPAVRWHDFILSSGVIIHNALEQVLSACAFKVMPQQARLIMPSSTSAAAKRLVLRRLAGLGLSRCEVIAAPNTILNCVSTIKTSKVLVVEVLAFETRLTLLDADAKSIANATSVAASYVCADAALASSWASLLPPVVLEKAESWQSTLITSARKARHFKPQGPWRLNTGAQSIIIASSLANKAYATLSENLALTCELVTSAYGVDSSELTVIVAPEEPLWMGLSDTFNDVFGHEPIVLDADPWLRLRGLKAK
ncbi:MAG: TIGR02266 family protein [Deltaproteobacteria bacterium]|nr:TIGR02266 family protein [Deltaproteobacteria bacterium]